MATESATLRAAARVVSLAAFYAATRLLDQPKIREKARVIDREIEKLQGVAESKSEVVQKKATRKKTALVAGVAVLAVAGILIARAASHE